MLEYSMDSIDWESIFLCSTKDTKKYINEIYNSEQTFCERRYDLSELIWLTDECDIKFNMFKQCLKENQFQNELVNIYAKRIQLIRETINYYFEKIECISMEIFLKIKYDLRSIMKELGGLITSSDWQSPASCRYNIQEYGSLQVERDKYMRTSGSDFVKEYDKKFLEEYYDIPQRVNKRVVGFSTSSGMKALELALFIYKTISKEQCQVYYQSNFYYEGLTLIRNFFPNSKSLLVEEIYEKIDKNEEIGCLIIDPGTTWPFGEGIDLGLLFEKLKKHNQKLPLFIIVDRTITSTANQLIEKYCDFVQYNQVLISFESGLKYYQYGLDIANVGFIVIYGSIIRMKNYIDLIMHLLHVISAIPDHSLIRKLPTPCLEMAEKRLSRIARNSNILYSLFIYLKERLIIKEVYRSINCKEPLYMENKKWNGSLLYIKLHNYSTFDDYDKLASELFLEDCNKLYITRGSSFGFDTMRVGACMDMDNESNCTLRISVGRDTLPEILEKAIYFKNFFIERKKFKGGIV